MPACVCPFGPRCESCYDCEDPIQYIGLRDRRTGAIRAKADWSIFIWHERAIKRAGLTDYRRVMFYCNPCLIILHEVTKRPLRGIDRQKHADDSWKPSLRDHLRLNVMSHSRTN